MRTLSTTFRVEQEASESGEHGVELLKIGTDVYVANDNVDYEYGGITYVGFPFILELVSDDEGMPRARLTIQNVDGEVGRRIRATFDPLDMEITLLASADFGAAVSGVRSPTGTPTVEYSARFLSLRSIQVDAMAVTAEVVSYDDTSEPWPSVRTTPNVLPGLSA